MAETSEARKRHREADLRLAAEERRREVAQQALEVLYDGAGFLEADALIDALADRGARIEVQ